MTSIAYSYLRFSTSEQAKGDSRRRQIAMAVSPPSRTIFRPSLSVLIGTKCKRNAPLGRPTTTTMCQRLEGQICWQVCRGVHSVTG